MTTLLLALLEHCVLTVPSQGLRLFECGALMDGSISSAVLEAAMSIADDLT